MGDPSARYRPASRPAPRNSLDGACSIRTPEPLAASCEPSPRTEVLRCTGARPERQDPKDSTPAHLTPPGFLPRSALALRSFPLAGSRSACHRSGPKTFPFTRSLLPSCRCRSLAGRSAEARPRCHHLDHSPLRPSEHAASDLVTRRSLRSKRSRAPFSGPLTNLPDCSGPLATVPAPTVGCPTPRCLHGAV